MSNFYIGTQKPSKIYIGTTPVNGIYLGTEKVWSASLYTQLQYIQSSGTQYIDTGITANMGVDIEVNGSKDDYSEYTFFCGVRDLIIRWTEVTGICSYDGKWGFALVSSINDISSPLPDTNAHTFKLVTSQEGKGKCYIDGTNVLNIGNSGDIGRSLYLFARNDYEGNNNPMIGKIYWTKIWQSGTLVRDYVPCRRNSDNEIGMLDLVSNEFFINIGTGDFTGGPDVN